jgi:hypothetical protein
MLTFQHNPFLFPLLLNLSFEVHLGILHRLDVLVMLYAHLPQDMLLFGCPFVDLG